jgi:hypothetical protein
VLAAIAARAESVGIETAKGSLRVHFADGKMLTCREPAAAGDYAQFPASFRNVTAKHRYILFPDTSGWALVSGEGDEVREFVPESDDSQLADNADAILCPFTDFSDWWIFHPTERNPQGEPVLCLFSHESCKIEERAQYNVGSLLLRRMAEVLNIDVEIPAIAPLPTSGEDAQLTEIQKWWDGLDPLLREEIKDDMKLREELDCTPLNLLRLTKERDYIYLGGRSYSDITPLAELTSIAGIERFKKLRRISITDTKVTDFSPLYNLTELEILTVGGNGNTSYEWLRNLKGLQELRDITFTRLTEADTLEGVDALTQLKSLTIYGRTFSDISAIANLTTLESLTLEGTSVSDLKPLEKLENLELLNLKHTKISALEPLRELKNLDHLNLGETNISSIEPLKNLRRLTFLCIDNTDVDSLAPLAQLEKLERLYFQKTKVSSLEPLKNLKKLKHLYFFNTDVDSLAPIAQLERLENLFLDNTKVTSLEPIKNFTELEEISCEGTAIPPEEVEALKPEKQKAEEAKYAAAKKKRFIEKLVYAMDNEPETRTERNAALHKLLKDDIDGLKTFVIGETDRQYTSFVAHFWQFMTAKRYDEIAAMVTHILAFPLNDERKQRVLSIGICLLTMAEKPELEKTFFDYIPAADCISCDGLAYNLACYFAAKKSDKTNLLKYLKLAIILKKAAGATNLKETIPNDGDFAAFKNDPDFLAIVNEL